MDGLEDDPEASRVVAEELRLLAVVQRALLGGSSGDAAVARGRALDQSRLLELRDDVAVAKPEDLPSLFEQMHHVGALHAQRGRSVGGAVDRMSPYFGHMRLEEVVPSGVGKPAGTTMGTRRRDVLIGARSYVDSERGIRIVDWRHAPVSRIYYRYAEGDDYEEELGDRVVEGAVVARRAVSIVGGELVRVSASQGTFARGKDGRWMRVSAGVARLETGSKLGPTTAKLEPSAGGSRAAAGQLSAIAALLDPAQFELITRDAGGLMVVQGSAGSGKTTVGLHRAAYLAYRDPQRFRPDRMLVVAPNHALTHYVSRVLPSLGVDGVTVTTFAQFASRLMAHLFPKLPVTTSEDTPPVVSRAKSHIAMLRGIDRITGRLTRELEARLHAFAGKWPDGGRVVPAWEATGRSTALDARVGLLSQWLAGRKQLSTVSAAAGLPEVTRAALEQLLARERTMTRTVPVVWDELLTSRELLAEVFADEPGFASGQLDQVHAWCVRQARVRADGERDGETPTIDAEDRGLLLRCWQALRGPIVDALGKPVRLAHLFVDEVQDAGPVELRVLLDLADSQGCVTLAGDVAQRLLEEGDDRGEFDWGRLLDGLGVAHSTIEPLNVSYRSTAEITEFARRVLGPLAHPDMPEVTHHGPPVQAFGFASSGETVAWLVDVLKQLARDEPDSNVALIARFPQQADVYYEGLVRADLPNVRRVAKQDFSWEPGIDVTDVRQTKGLEFDAVILIETTAASYPPTPAARHALYVAATRASHQLWCVSSEAPSALVTAAVDFT